MQRFDHMDPISHASQAFFQVAAKAVGTRLNRRSVVIPSDGDDGKYVVSSRSGDPEGVVEVVVRISYCSSWRISRPDHKSLFCRRQNTRRWATSGMTMIRLPCSYRPRITPHSNSTAHRTCTVNSLRSCTTMLLWSLAA